MTVFVTVQVKITDRERYSRYEDNFMGVFNQFDGTVLVNDYTPSVLEGKWEGDKVVVISFPSKQSFTAWASSEQYQAIVGDRLAAGEATIILSEGLDQAQQG